MPTFVCGRNDDGALGLAHQHDVNLPTLVESLSTTRVLMVATGSGHTAFLTADGKLLTAGRGDDNRLGHGDRAWCHTPTVVRALEGRVVVFVACGSYHTAMITDDGALWTCGGAMYSKLGHGNEDACPVPRPVAALQSHRVVSVACGSRHTVVLVNEADANHVYSFGDAEVCGHGPVPSALGSGVSATQATPVRLTSLDGESIQQIAACGFHTLALSARGVVFAWGEGKFGRLGLGTEAPAFTPTPVSPSTLRNVVFIAAGGFHSAAVDALGCVYVWGGGEHGALGLGSPMNQLVPVRVPALTEHSVTQVACGWSHTVFLCEDHSVFVTGNNDHGKCGLGATEATRLLMPRRVEALVGLPVVQVASYNEHTVFVTDPDGHGDDGDAVQHAFYAQYYLRAMGRAQRRTEHAVLAETGAASAADGSAEGQAFSQPPTAATGASSASSIASSPILSARAEGAFIATQELPSTAATAAGQDADYRSLRATVDASPRVIISTNARTLSMTSGGMPAGLPTASTPVMATMPMSMPSPPLTFAMRATGSSTGPSASYLLELARLVNNPHSFADVLFRVDGRTVHAHRAILATRCPQFAAMFQGGMRESSASSGCELVVSLSDVRHETFLTLLHFLYTDTLPPLVDADSAVELYAVAERFTLERLKLLCERKVVRGLTVDNAATLLASADADAACGVLRGACLRFLLDNFDAVIKTEAFRALPKELILEVLAAR